MLRPAQSQQGEDERSPADTPLPPQSQPEGREFCHGARSVAQESRDQEPEPLGSSDGAKRRRSTDSTLPGDPEEESCMERMISRQ